MREKEFLYVGYYVDVCGRFLLKVGTTNNLRRRQTEHNRNYKRAKTYTMPEDGSFEYLWSLPLSKYNTIRFEDRTKEMWQGLENGHPIPNDRFWFEYADRPAEVEVTIRKTYKIALP